MRAWAVAAVVLTVVLALSLMLPQATFYSYSWLSRQWHRAGRDTRHAWHVVKREARRDWSKVRRGVDDLRKRVKRLTLKRVARVLMKVTCATLFRAVYFMLTRVLTDAVIDRVLHAGSKSDRNPLSVCRQLQEYLLMKGTAAVASALAVEAPELVPIAEFVLYLCVEEVEGLCDRVVLAEAHELRHLVAKGVSAACFHTVHYKMEDHLKGDAAIPDSLLIPAPLLE